MLHITKKYDFQVFIFFKLPGRKLNTFKYMSYRCRTIEQKKICSTLNSSLCALCATTPAFNELQSRCSIIKTKLYLLFKENIFDLSGENRHSCFVFLSVLYLQLKLTASLTPVNLFREDDLEITNAPPILENPRRLKDSDWLVRARLSMHLERPWVCLVAILNLLMPEKYIDMK